MCREIKSDIVTARKRHQCDFCSCWIEKGEKYLQRTFENDGEIYNWKCHLECDEIVRKLPEEFDNIIMQDGVTSSTFESCIDDYVRNHHSGEETWNVPLNEQVKMILKELAL